MTVAVTMEFEGATLDQYDEVIEKMGLVPGGPSPVGALFHWAAPTPTGLVVTDVWETQEQFDAFASSQIGPITMAVGVPNPPKITTYEVHSYISAG